MRINIIGSILGCDGYSSHCRGLSQALYKLNPDIKLDVPLTPTWTQEVNDAELEMIKKDPRTPDVTIMIATPPFWRIGLGDNCGKFVGYCVWEGDSVPKYWIEYLCDDRVDLIFVPSQHTKDAIAQTLRAGLSEDDYIDKMIPICSKIKIVPHGFNPEIFHSQELKVLSTPPFAPDNTFKIICNKGWRGGMEDRGGVQFLLKAYAEEFKKDENIELMLKLNPSYIQPEQVKQKIDELNLPKDAAKIKICCTNTTPNQICKLYNDSDLYVCPTRAEAFDLGSAEAMACGLPVITTGYGGQIEHMDENCADFVDYTLEEVKGDVNYEGVKWAVPNTQHLQKLLRESFIQRNKTKEKGERAKEFISSWTWDNTAKIIMDNLK